MIAVQGVANPLTARMHKGINTTMDEGQTMVAHSLRADGFDASEDGTGRGTPLIPVAYSAMPMNSGKDFVVRETEVAQPIMAAGPALGNQGGDYIAQPINFQTRGSNIDVEQGLVGTLGSNADRASGSAPCIAFDTTQITSVANRSVPKPGDPCHPLAAGAHAPCIAFDITGSDPTVRSGGAETDVHTSLRARPPGGSEGSTTTVVAQPYTIAIRGRDDGHNLEYRQDGTANAVLTPNGGRGGIGVGAIAQTWAVRRLTPTECERLQGFPDEYTNVPWRGKNGAPDGPRYKALGNSMACNCMRWIGMRIQLVSDIAEEAA